MKPAATRSATRIVLVAKRAVSHSPAAQDRSGGGRAIGRQTGLERTSIFTTHDPWTKYPQGVNVISRSSHSSDRGGAPDAEPITRFRNFILSAFQRQSIAALQEDCDVLVSAPTGAGKTLIAEFAVEQCIERGQRAIYTAPIKALSNQKFRDFRERNLETGIMTGDVTLHPRAPLLIMTTEIFRNTLFERGPELDDVGIVIFDEIHYMDDLERGTVWEESIIFAPPHMRILALSATVSNLRQFGDWIASARQRRVQLVESRERPVPLAHYLQFPGLGPRRADKVKQLPKRTRQRQPRSRQKGRPAQRGSGYSRADDLIDRLDREDRMPVLFFCFGRRECEIRARDNVRRHLLNSEQRDRVQELFLDICTRFEIQEDAALEQLRALALSGIGYHHAGLLPLHKELVERLFTSGLLRLLFTTETFALGINMPARSVVFSSLRKFDGVSFDRLKSRDYQQMAGRAGRLGLDDEGLVYSIIDDPRTTLSDVQKTIFGQIEPIRSRFNLSYSTLLNLHVHLGERIYEAWEKSFNNFQWSRMSRAKRERNEKRQKAAIEKRLDLLRRLGHLDGDTITEKGERARRVNGYELPVVELVAAGLFDALDDLQIAIVLTAVVYEGRKGDLTRRLSPAVLGPHRRLAERVVDGIVEVERELGITPPTRKLDFRAGAVVKAWWDGIGFADMDEVTNISHGDLVRNFRLVVQLLRQLSRVYHDERPMVEQIARIVARLDRDEVDAQRQLELG